MITQIKYYLKLILVPTFYFGSWGALLYSAYKNIRWAFLILVFIIPQPNITHKFFQFPLGKDFIDLCFISLLAAVIIQKRKLGNYNHAPIVITFIIYSYFSVINCSMRYSLPIPISTNSSLLVDWKNYAQMVFLYLIAMYSIEDESDIKRTIILITIVLLIISVRNFRNFSEASGGFQYDRRAGGPFIWVGLGANHLGAFIAHYCSQILGMVLYVKERKTKYLFFATLIFGLHPLFFAYSRGAYLAALMVVFFYGVIKKRKLLLMLTIVIIFWQIILPKTVVDRIMMTETEDGQIEGSAGHRLELWEIAFGLFEKNVVIGAGYSSFQFEVEQGELTDTHNYYVKTLAEQGIIGFILFLSILIASFRSGLKLLKISNERYFKGLGTGFMGCVVAIAVTNIFGDRFSYFSIGSYYWILWGIVDKSIGIVQSKSSIEKNGEKIT